jgi:hypothetical protein
MNKRIKELKQAAGIDYNPDQEGLNLFAELIAYECIDLALGSSHREDDMGAIIADKIKKHFGVEE